MHRPGEGVFERGSNVLDYWLANSEGFTVGERGGRRRVTAVIVDPETGRARSLVVQRSRRGRRTRTLAAGRIAAVDPHGRVLYVASRRKRRQRRASPRRPATRHAFASWSRARSGLARVHPVIAVCAAHAQGTLAILGALAGAYAHNLAAISAAVYGRAREATLRGPWTPTSLPSWTRHARRSLAARSRMQARLRRASQRSRSMIARSRS